MSFSFSQHHRHSQQLRKDRSKITPQGKKITKYIFLQNFYFYTCPEIGFKRVREFFADSQNSGLSLEVWHFSSELGKTPILVFCHQNWAKLQFWHFATKIGQKLHPGQRPQIRNDISPPAFRLYSVSPIFCPIHRYSLLIMGNVKFKSFVFLPAHFILSRSIDVVWIHFFNCYLDKYLWLFGQICLTISTNIWIPFLCTSHLFNSYHLLSNSSSVMKTFWKMSEYFSVVCIESNIHSTFETWISWYIVYNRYMLILY